MEEEAVLDDEFAKDKGYDSLEDMTVKTKRKSCEREESRVENDFRNNVIEKIIETSRLEVPKTFVNSEIDFNLIDLRNKCKCKDFQWSNTWR